MSRQLKRSHDEMNQESDITDSTTFEPPVEPRRKKRKIDPNQTHPIQPEYKEESVDTDITTNSSSSNQESESNKANKPKSKTKSKSKRKTTKSKTKKSKSTKSDKTPTDNRAEIERLKLKHRKLLEEGYKCIVGVDEAGRGPLAGPVVIAAAYVPIDVYIDGITDSKKINEESEREKLYKLIMDEPRIKYSITIHDHNIIDEYNILEASMMGMRDCVQKLHDIIVKEATETSEIKGVDYALADGNRDPRFEYPKGLKYEYIIKGDGNIYCIGAASIIAKVTRDRIMIEYDNKYPQYKFKENKGYPTPFHKGLVMKEGPCDIHRKSFKPVKDWYKINKPDVYKKMEDLKKLRAEERKKKLGKGKEEKKKGKKKGKKVVGQKSIMNFFGKKDDKKSKNERDGKVVDDKKEEEVVDKKEKKQKKEKRKRDDEDVNDNERDGEKKLKKKEEENVDMDDKKGKVESEQKEVESDNE